MATTVVSDKLLQEIESGDLWNLLGDNICIYDWDYFADNSVPYDVLVLDMDWSNRLISIWGEYGKQLQGGEEKFIECINLLKDDIPTALKSGDVVITLLDDSHNITHDQIGRLNRHADSFEWMDELSVIRRRYKAGAVQPDVISNYDPIDRYFNNVSECYKLHPNEDVVKAPDILASAPDDGSPVGIAINEFRDINRDKVRSGGTLVLLPQPRSLRKPHEIVNTLSDIGAIYFHDNLSIDPKTPDSQVDPVQEITGLCRKFPP